MEADAVWHLGVARSERKAVGIRQCREHSTAYCLLPKPPPRSRASGCCVAIGGAAIEGAVAFGAATGRKSQASATLITDISVCSSSERAFFSRSSR